MTSLASGDPNADGWAKRLAAAASADPTPWSVDKLKRIEGEVPQDDPITALEKTVESRLRDKKAKIRVDLQDDLPYSLTADGIVVLPSNFADSPCGIHMILARLVSKLSLERRFSTTSSSPVDTEQVQDFCLGIIYGLDETTLSRKNYSRKTEFDTGRSVVLHERRLAAIQQLHFSASRLYAPDYIAGTKKTKKLFSTQILRFTGVDQNLAKRVHDLIERLLKAWVRDHLPKVEHPADLLNDFNHEWALLAPTRVVIKETKKSKKTVQTSIREKYHPKRPSAMVGIFESEMVMVKTIFDLPWDIIKAYSDKNEKYVADLIREGEQAMFAKLEATMKRQTVFYDVVRRVAHKRISALTGAKIPAKQVFNETCGTYFYEVKQGKAAIESWVYPDNFLDFAKIGAIEGTTYPRAVSREAVQAGNYNTIIGLKEAVDFVNSLKPMPRQEARVED